MVARRDRIFEIIDGWRKEHLGEPINRLVEEISDVTALKSARLKDIRSFLAECESKKTALENEFPHLKRVHSPFSEQQEDWEYNLCDVLIPRLRLEISRRGARTGTRPKESIASKESASPAQNSANSAQAAKDKTTDRHAMVEAYIQEVLNEKGERIMRKDIWAAAGYKTRTEFERWERQDPKRPNKAADNTFTRILCIEKPHLK